jgi:hypothetical protein
MNLLEKKMFEILKKGKEYFNYTAVRAEFETEGARSDELLRLVDIAYKAGVDLAIKIGGCEAVADLNQARLLGAASIVAPMVESVYALKKYILACERVFPESLGDRPSFLFNIETINAFDRQEDLFHIAKSSILKGVVFGRVDFVGSLGLSRSEIESQQITEKIQKTAAFCKDNSLQLIVGGAISVDSLPALTQVSSVFLSHFETRKIVFGQHAITLPNIEEGLLGSVEFELLWLKNKKEYYGRISQEDHKRIELLEKRWHLSAERLAA